MINDDQIQRMHNAPPREICEHGSQKVKCVYCDNIALEDEIATLRNHIKTLYVEVSDDRARWNIAVKDAVEERERAECAEAEITALRSQIDDLRARQANEAKIVTHNKTAVAAEPNVAKSKVIDPGKLAWFSVNEYNMDGYLVDGGIFLHFGETRVKVANSIASFKAFIQHMESMIPEIEKNY